MNKKYISASPADVYTAKEIAEILKVSVQTVRNRWRSGELAFILKTDRHGGRCSTADQINDYLTNIYIGANVQLEKGKMVIKREIEP